LADGARAYAVRMETDWIDAGAHLRCPSCAILLRHSPASYRCPACDYEESMPEVEYPGAGVGLLEFRVAHSTSSRRG
jgi:uncharacterized OB-fold protein